MKVLVLGATRGVGREVVRIAARRHEVVALVRSKLTATELPEATLIEGDARDPNKLARAVRGCDAVIYALGAPIRPWRRVNLFSTTTKSLIAAMEQEGVRRLVCLTGVGAGDSRGHGGFFFDRLIQPLLLQTIYDDKDRQEAIVRASDLDWILVRPTQLTNARETGRCHVITDLRDLHGGHIARSDVARFMVDQVEGDQWLQRAPAITN